MKDAAVGRHGPRSPTPDSNGGMESGTGNSGGSGSGSGGGGPGGEPDAETRRNAVRSLASLCEEVGVGEGLQGASRVAGGGGDVPRSGGIGGGGGGGGGDRDGNGWCPVGLTLGDVEGVLGTLLAAAEDYSVDKRGDVGSWCRVDALAGMERLLRLAARASRGLPLANRGEWEVVAGVCALLLFALTARRMFFERRATHRPWS